MAKAIKGALEAAEKAPKAAKKKPPLIYPAVAPKTKQEIQALADRMARQIEGTRTNQFVRLDPKKSLNPAGKSKKQFEREVSLPVRLERTEEEFVPPVVNIADLEGSVIVGVPGDPSLGGIKTPGDPTGGRMIVGARSTATPTMLLRGVGDVDFEHAVPLFGGPRYGEHLPEHFWASNLSAARGVQNQINRLAEELGVPVYGEYIKMTPESTNFSVHALDSVLQYVRPDKMPKGKRKELEQVIRRGMSKKKPFKDFVGFEDLDLLLEQAMGMDVGKGSDSPSKVSDLRKMVVNTLIKPTVSEQFGLRPGMDAFTAIQNPAIRNLETGTTGYSIGRMMPGRALEMSEHPTYTHDIPGALIGQSRYPTPVEISMPRSIMFAKETSGKNVVPFNKMKMSGVREVVDPQYVDERLEYERMMRDILGYKKGGKVNSPLGALSKLRKRKHG